MEEHKFGIHNVYSILYYNLSLGFSVNLFFILSNLCRFLKNAVPQINGVAIPVGASIAYFVLSLVTLLFLYL